MKSFMEHVCARSGLEQCNQHFPQSSRWGFPLPEAGADELRVHCRTVWRGPAGQRGAKMVQTDGGKTEQSRKMQLHGLGAWQVRGPQEGVGCKAGEDRGSRSRTNVQIHKEL